MSKKRKTLFADNEHKMISSFKEMQQFIIKPDISTDQKLKSYVDRSYRGMKNYEYLITRRLKTAGNLEKEGFEHIKKVFARKDSVYSSVKKAWYDFAVINHEFPDINLQSGYSTPFVASAIFLLEQIKKAGKTQELINLINERLPEGDYPKIEDLKSDIEACNYNHKYPLELIVAVGEVISDRNARTPGFKNTYFEEENFVNRQIVNGKQLGADSVNRKLFEEILSLIPEKAIRRSVERTKKQIWSCADICMEFHEDFESYMMEQIPYTDRQIDEVITSLQKRDSFRMRQNPSKKKTIDPEQLNEFVKNFNPTVQMRSSAVFPVISDGIPDDSTFSDMNINNVLSQAQKITDNVNLFITLRECQRNICPLMDKLFKSSYDSFESMNTVNEIPDGILEKFRNFDVNRLAIPNPEEFIFSLIYMFDQNIDEAYLLPVTALLFDIAMYSLPWAGGRLYKSRFRQKRMPKEVPDFIRDFMDKKVYVDMKDPKLSKVNMGHMFWHLCGKMAPPNINDYLNKYRYIQDYDIPDEYKTALAFASAVVSAERASASESEKLAEQEFILSRIDDEEDLDQTQFDDSSKEMLHKTVKNYIQKNKNLITELKREKTKTKEISEENEQLKEQLKTLQEDYEILRLAQETEEELSNEDIYDYPYTLKHRYAVFGGYEKLIAGMGEYFEENVVFDSDTRTNRFEKEYVRNADVVCILIKNIGHSVYYSIIDEAKRCGKELIYINCRNNELMAKAIIKKDKELCEKERGN